MVDCVIFLRQSSGSRLNKDGLYDSFCFISINCNFHLKMNVCQELPQLCLFASPFYKMSIVEKITFSNDLGIICIKHLYTYLWSPYVIGRPYIFLPCSFFPSFFLFFSSPNLSGRRSDVYHTSTHGVALVRI